MSAGPAHKSAADQGRQTAELIRRTTPGRRLQIAQELYETAWQLKEAGLRRQHPDWTHDAIRAKCRLVLVTGPEEVARRLAERSGVSPD